MLNVRISRKSSYVLVLVTIPLEIELNRFGAHKFNFIIKAVQIRYSCNWRTSSFPR